jgi:hypothetical protein
MRRPALARERAGRYCSALGKLSEPLSEVSRLTDPLRGAAQDQLGGVSGMTSGPSCLGCLRCSRAGGAFSVTLHPTEGGRGCLAAPEGACSTHTSVIQRPCGVRVTCCKAAVISTAVRVVLMNSRIVRLRAESGRLGRLGCLAARSGFRDVGLSVICLVLSSQEAGFGLLVKRAEARPRGRRVTGLLVRWAVRSAR